MKGTPQYAYVALGANLGQRAANLHTAVNGLTAWPEVRIARVSPIYDTQAYGGGGPRPDRPRFLNAVVEVETTLTPRGLLDACLAIERAMGRTRNPNDRYGARVIDLDVLLHGDAVLDEPDLKLPHPRIAQRPFVLAPLADLIPDYVLPGQTMTVSELLERVPGREDVKRV